MSTTPTSTIEKIIIFFGFILFLLAWLVPNKLLPWPMLLNESLAALGGLLFGFIALATPARGRNHAFSGPGATLLILGVSSAWAQHASGLLDRAGDAWLVTLYLGLFVLAVSSGRTLAGGAGGAHWRDGLLLAIVAAGLLSAGVTLVQWLGASPSLVFLQEIDIGDRPYANLGQPNHASTLLFLALCAALQLRRERIVGQLGTLLAALLLTFAMALTQSRTGVMQWTLLLTYGLWVRPQGDSSTWRWGSLVLVLGLLSWVALPWLYEFLLLAGEARALASGSSGRLEIWLAFLDAVAQRPWAGWGWLQTGWAQQTVATNHPNAMAYFSYTHFLPLDLVLWLGVPLGLLLCGVLSWWLAPYLAPFRSAQAGCWLVAVLGVGLHALLEYPQTYLYFLLPVGLMIGVIEAQAPAHRVAHLPATSAGALCLAIAALAAVVFWDALRASNTFNEVRFAEARIGISASRPELPRLQVLDQLNALVQLRATAVDRLPSQDTLHEAARVAQRHPLRWVLLRYAQLLALAEQPEVAALEQQRLCDIYGAVQCSMSGRVWNDWRSAQDPQGMSLHPFQGEVLTPR